LLEKKTAKLKLAFMRTNIMLLLLLVPCLSIAQPSNDDPCSAIPLPVTTGGCVYTNATNTGATPVNTTTSSFPAPGCAFYFGGDVWFTAVVPANGILIVDTDDGTMTDSGMAFYSGNCSSMTLIECDDSDSPNGNMSMINASGLTPGSTVYIRVWSWGNSGNGTFDICASTLATPANDDPCNATVLSVDATCSYNPATNLNATSSPAIPAPGCAAYNGGDVWFAITVPASGAVQIDTQTGTMTDGGMAVYSAASCSGPFTLVACDDDSSPNGSMPQLTVLGQAPGSTLYIRIWEFNNDNNGTFGICAVSTGPCGFPETSDFCPSPDLISQGGGTFSSTTDGTFSADMPGNLSSVFCGTIENNSWYQFTALSTTEAFPITSVTGCTFGNAIQVVVYQLTYNANGCCTSFTQMSNCYSPNSTATGTVTATGLTPGNQYLLMVDGYSNDGCEFTISGWSVITSMPVELLWFTGNALKEGNELSWKTAGETSNSHFELLHSANGIDFQLLATIEGEGTTFEEHTYTYFHALAPAGVNYYRLRQVDFNGESKTLETISVDRKMENEGLIGVFPNPVNDLLHLQYNLSEKTMFAIKVYDCFGQQVFLQNEWLAEGFSTMNLSFDGLSEGIYWLETTSGNATTQQRIIKIDRK